MERLARSIKDLERDGDIDLDGMSYSRHEASIQIANGELSFDAILRTLFEQERIDAAIWLIGRKINLADEVVADTLKSDADGAIMRLMLQTGIHEKKPIGISSGPAASGSTAAPGPSRTWSCATRRN
ncbi:hypothetical protein QW131_13785 [Roseibium salinum]|nr:hypothetical protein [Roseibium salinum]